LDAVLHRRCANTIKGLAMDGVQAANSGHPGMPMGMADVATVLWTRFLKFDPEAPTWPDRDRFVLSAGHGSMLLYSLLHLSGFDLPIEELRRFRQWDSKTPGHPEHGHTTGVETTTGPLGQGFANAVGFALTERYLRETFGPELCDHFTYGICSDGDLMEGISSEAASFAGHLGLGRLVMLYDDNHISIDGDTALAFTEDAPARLAAMGWHVQRVDGHDVEAVVAAIETARATTDRPSLVACRTIIGHGSPKFAGSEKSHGAALGDDEVAATKVALGLDPKAHFVVPDDVRQAFRGAAASEARQGWETRLKSHPEADKFRAWIQPDWDALVEKVKWPSFEKGSGVATRKANAACVKAIVAEAPHFVGGSADLHESNGLHFGRPPLTRARFAGTGGIHFGVREHAMGAICNGIALHGGLRPYNATFLIFHDYQRPAVRLAALMHQPVLFIYSHDSFWLGEDGPTHQPIETLLALRAIPGIEVWRPGDALETVAAYKAILRHTGGPSAILTTRQALPTLDLGGRDADELVARGGYVVADAEGAKLVLMGTGSEVSLCLAAQKELAERGIAARVVSLPCRERLWSQPREYRDQVLPPGLPRVSVEAATTLGWERYVGDSGASVGIDRFGASAPGEVLAEKFGFTAQHVADVAAALLK
jgi:transketolase